MNTNYEYQVHAPNEFGGAGAVSIFGSLFTYSLDDAQRAAKGHKGAYVVRRILGSFGGWENVSEAVQPTVNTTEALVSFLNSTRPYLVIDGKHFTTKQTNAMADAAIASGAIFATPGDPYTYTVA